MTKVRLQIVILDKSDFIIKYDTFELSIPERAKAVIPYIREGVKLGDVRITHWNSDTGERI
jgi:hypothetical protein